MRRKLARRARAGRGRASRLKVSILLSTAAAMSAPALAVDTIWSNPAGGSFQDGGNWVGGAVPGSNGGALFNLGGAYTVSFSSAVQNQDVSIGDDVVFSLGGNTYSLVPTSVPNSLTLGLTGTQNAHLTLNGGTLGSLGNARIATAAGGSATLAVNAGGRFTGESLFVGNAGAGEIDVTGGGFLSTDFIDYLGNASGASGTLLLDGIGSTFSGTASTLYLGYAAGSAAAVTVTNGATANVGTFSAGYGTTSAATVTVAGVSGTQRSVLSSVGRAIGQYGFVVGASIGQFGFGTAVVSSGALLTTGGTLYVGPGTSGGRSGLGVLTVGGASGTWLAEVQASSLQIANGVSRSPSYPISGTVTLNAGGRITVSGVSSVGNATTQGNLIINGGTLTTGALNINAGGRLYLWDGTINLGSTATSGVPTSTLSGSGLFFSLSATSATGSANLNLVNNAVASLGSSQEMYVGGTYGAPGNPGHLSINDNAKLTAWTLTLYPAGEIDLSGGTMFTSTLSLKGGAFNWNGGTLWFLKDSFVVGSSGDLGSNLSLNPGQLLNMNGTATIDAAATLILNGGSLTTSSLINHGTFSYVSGGFTLRGADQTIGSGRLIGPNVTLNPGDSLASYQNVVLQNGASVVVAGGSLIAGAASPTSATNVLSIASGASLAINGGTVNAGSVSNAGSFALNGGTLNLTGSGLTVGPGGLLGSNITLSSATVTTLSDITVQSNGSVLLKTGGTLSSVTGRVGIDPGGSITVDGGTFGALYVFGPGKLNFVHGALVMASSASSLLVDTGAALDTLSIGPGDLVQSAGDLRIGYNYSGLLAQSGGTINAALSVGYNAGSSGTFTISGGICTSPNLFVGYSAGSSGRVSISGGTFVDTNYGDIGTFGNGSVVQNNGAVFVQNSFLTLGRYAGGSGYYHLTGGSLNILSDGFFGALIVGLNGGGTFVQDGGVLTTGTTSGSVIIGTGTSATASYLLNGGILTAHNLNVGEGYTVNSSGGSGAFLQNGGTVNADQLTIGYNFGGPTNLTTTFGGTYTMSSGATLFAGTERVGYTALGTFNQTGGTHSISGTLQVAANPGSSGTVNLSGGSLSAAATVNSGTFNQTGGVSSLGPLSGSGNLTVGGGTAAATATVSSFTQNNVTINPNGTLTVTGNTPHGVTNSVTALSIATNNALLDIDKQDLLVDNATTPFAGIHNNNNGVGVAGSGMWDRGYNYNPANGFGVWDGTSGLTSSTARASAQADGRITLGYIDGAWQNDPNIGDLGLGLATNRILVRPALMGDVNLDGVVDANDIGIIIGLGYYGTGTAPHGWLDGDLNGDGVVDANDIGLIIGAGTYNNGSYGPATAAQVATPEPSGIGLVAIGAMGLLARRRRKRGT